MNVYIYDSNHVLIDIIDSFNSLIWTEKYNEPSEFELFLPATEKLIKLFDGAVNSTYFAAINDSDEEMLIDNVVCKTENQGVKYLTIQGRGLITILERRVQLGTVLFNDDSITWKREELTDKTVFDIIRWFLNLNIIDPSIWSDWLNPTTEEISAIRNYYTHNATNRKINNFTMANNTQIQDPYEKITTKKPLSFSAGGNSIYEIIKSLCDKYHLGFKVIYQNGKYVFHVYDGYNRENIQFTPLFDNISDINTAKSKRGYMNVGILATNEPILQKNEETGQFEPTTSSDLCIRDVHGANLKEYSSIFKGLNMYEGVISKEVKVQQLDALGNIIKGSDTTEQYTIRANNALDKGLTENKKQLNVLECVIANNDFYKVKEDYNIGDIVYVTDYGGIINKMRVMEITYSYNSEGYNIYPSFSLWEEDEED